ncbi:MAG: 16S rRNA (guanine(527)-N(7))-methyltransferase RsmG [Cyanobacteria bacterium SW_9_44_58]|nr:MAG: 16S rRNA (guanine(527)-N(7))-methyltransferase RsmG [Cyanobacteria bacterium SW_9_44_58]
MLPEFRSLWENTLGWSPSLQQQQQLESLYQGISTKNRQLNLTRLSEPEAFWEKHLWDSLRGIIPLGWERITTASFIDIGCGAGFPGLPIAIALPEARVTLLDATRKKMVYLNKLIAQLGLSQVNTVTGRAETLGKDSQHRERYDVALLRAVAAAPVCAEYAFPFLKVGGIAVLYRGRWNEQEQAALNQALNQLGGMIWQVEAFSTPLTESKRHCLYLKKTEPTRDLFPRAVGMAKQAPLGN